jgi:hypothetical protein
LYERGDEEARKAAGIGPDEGAQRGRISFEVVKGLVRSQVEDDCLPMPAHRRCMVMILLGACRALEKVLLAQLKGGRSLLLGETRKRV